ncbi:MAG: WXG100 family type VII secretion target [Promicromonosporaceae bacterium]|nr:WXG100 family type VII secretion target [Promicromonosporaceae bacterium]
MSGIRVSPEQMDAAAREIDGLADRIGQCRADALRLNQTLQAAYDGKSAQAFDQFITGTASTALQNMSNMCAETARGIRHTLTQFTSADSTLAGVFNQQG